jgi:hypothetical protein
VFWRLLEGFTSSAGCVISVILAIVFVPMIVAAIGDTGSWSSVAYFVLIVIVVAGVSATISDGANRA